MEDTEQNSQIQGQLILINLEVYEIENFQENTKYQVVFKNQNTYERIKDLNKWRNNTMFMDGESHCCKDVHPPQKNLQNH